MEFDFNEDQKLFRDASRKFLEAECPATFVRQMMDDENAQDPVFWKKLAELGWTGMLIPEAYGGVDGTLTDMIVVAEEMGRSVRKNLYHRRSGVPRPGPTRTHAKNGDTQSMAYSAGFLIGRLPLLFPLDALRPGIEAL